MMKKIGVIGAGFSGMMTAIHLAKNSHRETRIYLMDKQQNLAKGTAYNSYSKHHLLNVKTKKMSAFPKEPNHFLNWVIKQNIFPNTNENLIAESFLPRQIYGDYLCSIYESYSTNPHVKITHINHTVEDLENENEIIKLKLDNKQILEVDQCVIATGNLAPKHPKYISKEVIKSSKYFQNPWQKQSVTNIDKNLPVLIIGNGLTMVDTVVGLLENGFDNQIYAISPNGFNLIPHRKNVYDYPDFVNQLKDDMSLLDILSLFNKHRKKLRNLGISAEVIVDSLRSKSQSIWQSFSDKEKFIFLRRLRHLWGVARHRLPLQIHDKIQQLKIDGILNVISGQITDIDLNQSQVNVKFYDKAKADFKAINVSRIINCTGPSLDLSKTKNNFLKHCFQKGIISQDRFKLGIKTHTPTYQTINQNSQINEHIFTIGPNLKGDLWESTAVNELRNQALELSHILIKKQKSYAQFN
ncbi:FAD/NAD(P)-binding protein [Flavobacterium sp. CS20]|uniref:FAD/NAD(P)-binding protein n=1 Tax=Flavobacterium sp. CS20 TaxID=2775246 RepID=UPI001B3A131F|nr:FAD/NAD(P)-binding protein [Flavobacterium sp. CS20]QTY26982.1 FAD/NAD(P)-binding protein [Flavobacterium sp. CS20]